MKTNVFNIFGFVVFATILAMTSCRDQDFDFEEHYPGGEIKKEYEQNWVKQMGAIDPEQDWCMAGEYSITVNVPGEEDVKVYALNPEGEYRLVGEYFGVSGIQTLKFDAIKGTKELLVSTNQGFKKTVVNGEVVFEMGTRAVIAGNNVSAEADNYINFTNANLDTWKNNLTSWAGYGSIGVPQYTYIPNSEYVYFYPLYWDTKYTTLLGREKSRDDEIGIYNPNNKNDKIRVFNTQDGSCLQYTTNKSSNNWTNCPKNDSEKTSAEEYRSQGIKVKVPWASFGIYIKNSDYTFYSEAENNPGVNLLIFGKIDHVVKCGEFIDEKNNKVLCLGDALDAQINKVLFRIEGVSTVNNRIQAWQVACEDLGDTGDYDFNDLVFKFEKTIKEHKNGANMTYTYGVNVTPLAAGGTLGAYFGFEGKNFQQREIHETFGEGTKNSSGKYKMINTNSEDNCDGKSTESFYIDYGDKNVTMAEVINNFYIRVVAAKASLEDSPTSEYENKDGKYIITAPIKGKAPQMIIVPDGWSWPKERISILDAYPEFSTWSSDSSKDDWDLAKAKDGNGDICPFYYQSPTASSGN